MSLKDDYESRRSGVLEPLAAALERNLCECLFGAPRIDRISARAKSVDRFLAKAQKSDKDGAKYDEPLEQIQDQIGARIVTFYLSDVTKISDLVERYYRPVESKVLVPESEWEFGYFGKHYVLLIPSEVIDAAWDKVLVPQFFELQVKTLFQHAWSEANHDLGYKPGARELTSDAKRGLAYASAQAWGADRMFDELFKQTAQ